MTIAQQARSVSTTDGTIAYTSYGGAGSEGPPIVLLPGFQSNAASWVERGYLPLLSDRWVLTIDPLGHGRSDTPHDEKHYTSDRVVAHVQAVLDQERIDAAIIWGFSRGGIIAALCGALLPGRCAAIIMGGSPLGGASAITHPPLAEAEPLLAAGDWASYWATFPVPLPENLKQQFSKANDPRACAAIIRAMLLWEQEVPRHGLEPTGVPALAYFGSGEVFSDELRAELIANNVSFFEGAWAGHAETMADCDGVVTIVEAFLADQN